VQDCVDQVMHLVRSPAFNETEESRQRLNDIALAWHVRAAMRVSPATRGLRVMVSADKGRVTLSGMVDNGDQRAAANEVAAQAGARDINDQMRSTDAVRPRFS
jgi:osmotically-inducible protein OsmY